MISKELLSEVLGYEVLKVQELDFFEGHYFKSLKVYGGKYQKFGSIDTYTEVHLLPIHELAHKCKKWALTKGYIVDERGVNIFVLTDDGIDVVWKSYGEPFCPHRVFEPCEWIMEIIALKAQRKIEKLCSLKYAIDNKMIRL